ncbi:hypothetical protein [Maribellus sp. YY47]|uniref:hypothetical protein n=1 Tax=Maribellus sp. YY47 TaxID=2929486 RepID=UPI002000D436|nr:hypothetical protein [Maribellus sp. YY47]MCK3682835.1 hypothetical protein [Maribellus sp. YY47]
MKSKLFLLLILSFCGFFSKGQDIVQQHSKSIRSFGVLPENTAEINKVNLQKAIDWAATNGAALFVEPSDKPYEVSGGLVLKKNVSLIGVHGPVPRSTRHPEKQQPVGSVFAVRDTQQPFITVESSTQIKGIQFWYPEQSIKDPSKVIPYPPTIQVSQTSNTEGVLLENLTFYGEYMAMDFNASPEHPCELIQFENCHGYPQGGEFIRIDYCYDIPRILHCHVNPAVQRQLGGQYPRAMVDAVVAQQKYSYAINHTDNAQMMDVFTFGNYGGIWLGPATYGQLTNFNLDCVAVGIYKQGDSSKNRNWMIAQGSIIANTGPALEDVHPIIVEGKGHIALTNVEAFSGENSALSNFGQSWDFMTVRGNEKCTISLFGCRMRDYNTEQPISVLNPAAIIQAEACIDKNENPFRLEPEK